MTPRERDYYLRGAIGSYLQFLYTFDYGRRRLTFEAFKDDEEYIKRLWGATHGINTALINAITVLAEGLGTDAGTLMGEYLRAIELGEYGYEPAPEDIDDFDTRARRKL